MKATKLPSGNWRIRVYIGTDANNKKVWKSVTAPTKARAELEAAQFKAAHEQPLEDRGTFAASASAFLRSRRAVLSPATYRNYQSTSRCLAEYLPWLCTMPIYSISTKDLQRAVDDMVGRGLSAKTVKNYYGFISVVLDYEEIAVRPPRLPQKERPPMRIPDEDTVRRVIEAAKGTNLEVPIMLAAFGPLRRGEICALTMADIQGDTIHVCKDMVKGPDGWTIKPPKTYTSDRYITMPHEVVELIRRQGYVVDCNPDRLYKRFRQFLRRNDIPPFRFHDLRHFCCSYLHGLGVPDIYIMQRSGHSTSNTLRQIYTHTLQDQSEQETTKMLQNFEKLTRRVDTDPENP